MVSACGRYVITFNGEVYNYRAIRRDLEDQGKLPVLRGASDTEVMLAAISAWGLERAVEKFIGMFAFALWDREERSLSLVRDRIGIKPLYYGWAGTDFVFGSELKALRQHPAFAADLDPTAIGLYFTHMCIPAPYSIYTGVFKLQPGHIFTVSSDRFPAPADVPPASKPYWSARDAYLAGRQAPWPGTEDEAVEELERVLTDSVRLRMIADVPLGAFLSGGIDSSTVVSLMQRLSTQPVKTFSIGFHEWGYDEAVHAKKVARHLGTDHMELYVTERQALDEIPTLPEVYDEPFADSSQIPTLLVAKMARKNVTVVLSGDGGDELFLGYPRYAMIHKVWRAINMLPLFARLWLSRLCERTPEQAIAILRYPLTPLFVSQGIRPRNIGHWFKTVGSCLSCHDVKQFYEGVVSNVKAPVEEFLIGIPRCVQDVETLSDGPFSDYQMMSLKDLTQYLPDDILVKVDRATMAVSLEARVPLLDHRVVEFAARIPVAMKIKNGKTKHLLRRVLDRYVPNAILERPKQGFGVPLEYWFKTALRDWVETTLSEKRTKESGFLDPARVQLIVRQHMEGERNWDYCIWNLVMFQSWLEAQKEH
jgi:asparagine synthase (glutamine-hydrolysing)